MTKKVKLRTLLIGGLFTLFFIILIGKLYWVQVVNASWLLERAEVMWEKNNVLQPVRGPIVDRNDQVLAENGPSYTVVVNPQVIKKLGNEKEIVRVLADILDKSPSSLTELVRKSREDGSLMPWVEVRNEGWKIDADIAQAIADALDLKRPLDNITNLYTHGILLEESQKRYYPSGSLAAHVLGYFDKNGKAVMGIEARFDEVLRGKPGHIVTAKDRLGYVLPDAKSSYEPAIDGKKLQLTIDRNIQSYMESALERAYAQWKPKSMTAIAMDPKTGEILGMANMPTFEPANYWKSESSAFFNHAVGSQYEPGSTFKLVPLAGAVEEGLFDPEEKFKSGSIKVLDRTLHDHERNGWGMISYLEGLKRSSNVAFVKLGYEKLQPAKLEQYIQRFGFKERTGIDLPGEAKGLIRFQYPVDYATATYGQGGVSVTAIQQIAAYAAIANGGKLMQPYIVKSIWDTETNQPVEIFEPKVVREAVSASTAAKVTEYLEQVISDREIGTGRSAYIEGYRVAGKTGTANKVINGQYSRDKWMLSFAGFAPAEDPKIALLVIADEPELNGDYRLGGQVTAPVFKEIMSQSLRYLGVSATVKHQLMGVEVKKYAPDLVGQTLSNAKRAITTEQLRYEILGKGNKVLAQFPAPGTEIGQNHRIYILTEQKEDMELPDLSGKSLRDALAVCSFMNMECKVSGEGYVVDQETSSDSEGRFVTLLLEPLTVTMNKEQKSRER